MILGIGIDIVVFDQMESACKKQEKFYEYLLTKAEIKSYQDLNSEKKIQFLASRFAVKEAFSKAMGTGIGKKVNFQNITVLDNEKEQATIEESPFDGKSFVSISHSKSMLIAQVV
ncbi:MAG: holo-ACP synthase [Atopostipes suicloacalis]|nr:holo-ACP synthase [Atopostipes suicloacalis]